MFSNSKIKTKPLVAAFCAVITSIVLTGCGLDPWSGQQKTAQQNQSWGMPGPVSANTLPDKRQQTSKPVQAQDAKAKFEPRGLNLEDYFAYDIKNPIERTRRAEHAVIALEKQVVQLQKEVAHLKQANAYAPHPSSFAPTANAVPQKIASKPEINKGMPSAAQAPQQTMVKADLSGPLKVSQFRLGEHTDRTRLVFDANGPVKYSYDIDNVEKLLVVDLKGSAWNKAIAAAVSKSSVVAGFNAYDSADGGTTLVIQLKKQAQVIKEALIQPNNISPYYRLVLDLSK